MKLTEKLFFPISSSDPQMHPNIPDLCVRMESVCVSVQTMKAV